MKLNLLFLALLFTCTTFFYSCDTKKKEDPVSDKVDLPLDDGHNAENSLDYEGIYEGIVPCNKVSDCKEHVLKLELLPNNIFVYSTKDASNNVLQTTGSFHFLEDGSTIVLDQIADNPNHYLIGEDIIYQIDSVKNKVGGADSEKYSLKKIQ